MHAEHVPDDATWLLDHLFETVLDGRDQYVADGVNRALGRAPRDFHDFARRVAVTGGWAAGARPSPDWEEVTHR